METVALLEFDIKYGPTIVQSCGEIEIPKTLVNWALQALQDDSYSTGTMNGYFYGGVKFSLRSPLPEDRGGRRSFSFLLMSENEIHEFKEIAEKILEWVHTRVDGEVRQVEHLEAILRQLAEQDVLLPSSREKTPKSVQQASSPDPIEPPSASIDSLPPVPEKKVHPPPATSPKTRPSEQVIVEAVRPQAASLENVSSRLAFEETQIPLLSFIACQWIDTTKQVKVRLQIGKPLSSRHLRILTLLALGCEKEREQITLSFGNYMLRRIPGDIILIGQPNDNNHNIESNNFFDIFGSVLAHFPGQTTFFLNLYRKNQSVFLTYTKKFSENPWNPNENVEDFYVRGLERLISHMDSPLSLQKLVEILKQEYTLLEVLYMIVVLNNLGMVEIRAKQGTAQNIPHNLGTL